MAAADDLHIHDQQELTRWRREVLEAAGSIVQVEARHAAAVDLLIGKSPTPNGPFDKALSEKEVLKIAGPLIKS